MDMSHQRWWWWWWRRRRRRHGERNKKRAAKTSSPLVTNGAPRDAHCLMHSLRTGRHRTWFEIGCVRVGSRCIPGKTQTIAVRNAEDGERTRARKTPQGARAMGNGVITAMNRRHGYRGGKRRYVRRCIHSSVRSCACVRCSACMSGNHSRS